ncbi:MAG: AMP-binding protein [Myxococcota bacterium]|nr:AMP-binding protein [Myxococcota bacterium]
MEPPQRQQLALLRDGLKRMLASGVWADRLSMDHLADIRDLSDLAALPFTVKTDLSPALSRVIVPRRAIVRVHASSGTTHQPTVVAYTAGDLDLWARLVARGLAAVGVGSDSVVHSALGYGLFTGGLGFHAAAESLGATVVPASTGRSSRHLRLIEALSADVLFATPSYALHLAESVSAPPQIRLGVFGAEPWSEAMRTRLEAAWGMTAVDTYGLSEMIGPGVAWECLAKDGMHLNEDAFLPEVVDPVTGAVLEDGRIGELVLSSMAREAMPLLRYRTGDLTALERGECRCGETLVRMRRVVGRVDGMVVVRGVNIYPGQLEAAVLSVSEARGDWQAVVERPENLDVLTVTVEGAAEIQPAVEAALHDVLGLRVTVVVVPPGRVGHGGGKRLGIQDRR